MKALIVCHAGVGVGLGHLSRALVVSRALKLELGAQVKLLIQGDALSIQDYDKSQYQFIPSQESLSKSVSQIARQYDINLLVFDLHPMQVPLDIDDLFEELRSYSCKLIAVDGLVGHSSFLDMVFIPAFDFKLPPNARNKSKFVFGWDCFLLNVKKKPTPWKPGKKVLILSGGSDATKLGENWPSALNEGLPANVDLNWITGPYAQAPVWPKSPRIKMHNHIAPLGLDDLMTKAHYAVTVYGVSFYELLYYGIPTVVFSPYGNKDNSELKAISEMGMALVANDEFDAIRKLKLLMGDSRLASSMSLKSLHQMSVLGGNRIAKCIAKLID